MILKMEATDHAYKRAKKRLGWKKSALDKTMELAFHLGICLSDTKGELHSYIDGVMRRHPCMKQPRIYGENMFCFTDYRLITLYRLDNQEVKLVERHREEMVSDR